MSKDKVIQTDETIKALLSKIEFQDWTINFRKHKEAPYLQLTFEAPCNVSGGDPEVQHCRKWALQYVMTDSEIVRTAYKAVKTAVLHEMDELFLFDGEMIYSPHTNIYALVELRREEGSDKR